MSNEIGQLKSIQAPTAPDRDRASRSAEESAGALRRGGPAAQEKSDEVQLSSSALKLRETEQRLAQQGDIDQRRVDAIRDALNTGSYRVDAGRLADGLLAQERLFLAAGKQ